MKVTGSAVLSAAPDAVYAALNDPVVLSCTIPGCNALTALGEDRYAMSVTAGVASITGTYEGEVALTDHQPPNSFILRAKGSGAPGTVDATVRVTLAGIGDGTTRLDYAADAAVGGMVGGVGQRILTGVARKMAGQFFAGVDDVLTGRRPPAPLAVGEHALAAPGVPQVHAQAGGRGEGVSTLVAFAAGAAVALVGVAVGSRLGRHTHAHSLAGRRG